MKSKDYASLAGSLATAAISALGGPLPAASAAGLMEVLAYARQRYEKDAPTRDLQREVERVIQGWVEDGQAFQDPESGRRGLTEAAWAVARYGVSDQRSADLGWDPARAAAEVIAAATAHDRFWGNEEHYALAEEAIRVTYQVLYQQVAAGEKVLIPVIQSVRGDIVTRAGQVTQQPLLPTPLSQTMQEVAKELSGPSASSGAGIRASEIAQAVAARHPELAGGRLGTYSGTSVAGAERSWSAWLDQVSRLYDPSVLARSRHQVLDARLFLVGLASIEPRLQESFEASEIWVPLLLEIDEAAGPEGSALWSSLQQVQLGYGYDSDEASGEDKLGIQGEVNAVCAVITDRAVRPPLAVGLFGEWGSGKSFFMDKMRERIADLFRASQSRSGDEPRPLNVIQIRFNAWHYSDSSLWASLAIEIFERLADPEPVGREERDTWLRGKGDARREERQDLLRKLETYRGAKAALDAQRADYEAQRAEIERRRSEARERRRQAVQGVSFKDIAGELARDPEVGEQLLQISTELNVKPAVGELMSLAAELRTTAGYVPAVWRLVHHKTWVVGLAAVFLMLALATAALILGTEWAKSLATAAGSLLVAIGTSASLIKPAVRRVNSGMGVVESAIRTAQMKEAKLREQRADAERDLEVTLAGIDEEIAQTTHAMDTLDEKIAATQASANALAIGRQLYDFLADRAAGYQKHQGVIGMLHRDFRLLDAQLRAYQDPNVDREPGWPSADRVILYIDDLDRCPPAKVLEVLEAVHLLLALELFVVVVGVDSRWLQRSLRHQYRDLVTTGDPHTDPYLRIMPIEYLEKIFQIPLTLPAMDPEGYARLIASLAPTTTTPAPTPSPTPVPTTRQRARTSESPGGERAPTRGAFDVQPGSAASGNPRQSIDLTQDEVTFAQQLAALVDSPRAAKRLMNTYRLIRATRHVGSRSRFLGQDGHPGEYRAVLTLLAIAAGYPTMADRFLVALEEDAPKHGINRWSTFIAELNPTKDNTRGLLVPRDLFGEAEVSPNDEAATWAALHQSLLACVDDRGEEDDLEPYQRWGKIVARFSFTL